MTRQMGIQTLILWVILSASSHVVLADDSDPMSVVDRVKEIGLMPDGKSFRVRLEKAEGVFHAFKTRPEVVECLFESVRVKHNVSLRIDARKSAKTPILTCQIQQ